VGACLAEIQQDVGSKWEPELLDLLAQQKEQQQQQGGASDQRSLNSQPQQQLVKLCATMWSHWQDLQGAFASSNSISTSCNSSQNGSSKGSSKGSCVAAGSSTVAPEQQLARERSLPAQACIAASAFDLLGLLYDALCAVGDDTRGSLVLDTMLSACLHTCAGSDLHVFHALRKSSLEQQSKGVESKDATAAYNALMDALRTRYGQQITTNQHVLCKMVKSASEAAALVSF
jgi:hypothetical protein